MPGHQKQQKQKIIIKTVVRIYDNNVIEPYDTINLTRGLGQQ